jgi:phosphonate transport system permease protein
MDKIKKFFLPKPIVLSNGKVVQPAMSPMVYVIPILLVMFFYSTSLTGFEIGTLINRGSRFFDILVRMFPPNFGYFGKVWTPMVVTLVMSIVGTLAGAAFSIPAAYLSSENMVKSPAVKLIVRSIMSVLRTIPLLVLVILFLNMFGAGAFTGMVSLGVFTFTIMTKMFYELIDTSDMGPFEAIESSGASRVKSFWTGIMPQLWGQYISILLYNFEMNIRNAAILGYVGAGGIGILLNERLGWRAYPEVAMILLVLMVSVYLIESLSRYIRKRLL